MEHGMENRYELFAFEAGLSDATARAYRAGVADLETFLSERGMGPGDAGSADVEDWVDDMRARLSLATARFYLAAARRYLGWLSGDAGRPNPSSRVSIADAPASAAHMSGKPSLSPAQVAAVLAGIEERALSESSLRDMAIARLLLICGVRPGEAVAADVGDFVPGGRIGVLACGGMPVPLDAGTSSAVSAYLVERGGASPGDPLLASVAPRNRGGRMTVRSVNRVMAAALSPIGMAPGSVSFAKTAMSMAVESGATAREARELVRLRSGYSAASAAMEADSRSGTVHGAVAELLGRSGGECHDRRRGQEDARLPAG